MVQTSLSFKYGFKWQIIDFNVNILKLDKSDLYNWIKPGFSLVIVKFYTEEQILIVCSENIVSCPLYVLV